MCLVAINYWLHRNVDEKNCTFNCTEYQKDIEASIPCIGFLKNLHEFVWHSTVTEIETQLYIKWKEN